eukprot:SAG11_NODE_10184_length_849_cov_0.729333_1_plen_170_part_00
MPEGTDHSQLTFTIPPFVLPHPVEDRPRKVGEVHIRFRLGDSSPSAAGHPPLPDERSRDGIYWGGWHNPLTYHGGSQFGPMLCRSSGGSAEALHGPQLAPLFTLDPDWETRHIDGKNMAAAAAGDLTAGELRSFTLCGLIPSCEPMLGNCPFPRESASGLPLTALLLHS